jgi:glucose/arabinose dehydrogenase
MGFAVLAFVLLAALANSQDAPLEVTGLQLVVNNAASASNASLVATTLKAVDGEATNRTVNLPAGFAIQQIATGLENPRFMQFDAAGNLVVADWDGGKIYRYPASGSGSIAPSGQPPAPLLSELAEPSNVALHDGYLYVGETRAIARYPYDPFGGVGDREVVVPDLPRGGHNTRTVVFGPDGAMYVSVGSSCNICDETDERRAAILRFASDGSGYQRFAFGLRNAVGLAIQPGSGLLWATVNERDNQGNEVPPDLVTIVREGENFGWPGCQPPDANPQEAGRDCSNITQPTIGIQAHSAPLGLVFNAGQQFPADYANDLFVVQHGSWNRQPPAAPKLLRVDFDGDRPIGVMDFATGWQRGDNSRWGRPAGVVMAPDGSLIVSDDDNGSLYRIVFEG